MKQVHAISALSALSHNLRLEVFRLLVRQGREGLPAGEIAKAVDVPNSSLSFHLAQLQEAGLVAQRREGRSLIYSADYVQMDALIGFLTENCCEGKECEASASRLAEECD